MVGNPKRALATGLRRADGTVGYPPRPAPPLVTLPGQSHPGRRPVRWNRRGQGPAPAVMKGCFQDKDRTDWEWWSSLF